MMENKFDFYSLMHTNSISKDYNTFYNIQKQLVFGQKAAGVSKFIIKKENSVIELNKDDVLKFSNIYSNEDKLKFKTYIDSLIPYSFGIWAKIKLTAPFYSADDDPFYPINPVLKEKVFKIPMLRGSGLKGALASIFKHDILDNGNYEAFRSFARIFGLGSDNFRKLITEIEKAKKNKQQPDQQEAVKKELIKFALFDLGIEKFSADSNIEIKDILKQIAEQKTAYLQPHKGRLIAYPLYFNRISLEVINPHNRQTRAGTQPIYYEVVPAGTTAFLQLVYISYDAINTDKQNIEKQVIEDLKNIIKALHILQTEGIGAKTKLGWGQFNIVERCTFCNNLPASDLCNKSEN